MTDLQIRYPRATLWADRAPPLRPFETRWYATNAAGFPSLAVLGRAAPRLAHAVGVTDPEAGWRLCQAPTFDNQLGTLRFKGRRVSLRIESTIPGDGTDPALHVTLQRQLA